MKKLLILLSGILLTATTWAQSPEKITYQAVIRDINNQLTINQSVGVQISILQGSTSGTSVYTETHTTTTNANGLVSLIIGDGSTLDDFSSIDWTSGPFFIKTETDPTGGTTYTITGISQLLSVPYAFHSKTADSIIGTIHYNEMDPVFSVSEASNITATDITNLGNLSGVNSGDQDISGIATNTQAIIDTAAQIRANIPVLPTNISAFSNDAGYLTTEVDGSVTNEIELPSQTGNSGKYLTTDGTNPSWASVSSTGGITTFGYVYTLATPSNFIIAGGADIILTNNGTLAGGITHTTGTTTIAVPSTGVYEIEYVVNTTSGAGARIAIAVNGTVDPSTNVSVLSSVQSITGTAILTLSAGSVITLRNNSATTLSLDTAPGIGAQVKIIQIN